MTTIDRPLQGQQTGSWGDQGDGTYRNPILCADYPDVDVEQVGDTYYMIASKQHMAPGMVILESKDMVNWTTIGHVWPALSWAPEYNWDRMDGYSYGTWAGDLAYHDGTWFCYQIDYRHGLYVSTAKDIRGPWTEPHKMLPIEKTCTDPAVFWDYDEGQAYLVHNTGDKLKSPDNQTPGNEIRLHKMSRDGMEILDEGEVIRTWPGAEAAKIYKVDGTFYFFLAEWYIPDPRAPEDPEACESDRKQLVIRSTTDSIYGPFESKIVMERGNGFIRPASQGALMQAPDGSWWYTHQLIQRYRDGSGITPIEGRPQCLEPVEWIDGWPIIGKDVEGHGIGNPVQRYRKPIDGYAIAAPPTDDEFNSPTLGLQWEWNHNPKETHWTLTERRGWLRLKASVPVDEGGFWKACNTISQRLMGIGRSEATAKFDISGMQPGQRVGFVRLGGVYHLLGVLVNGDGSRRLFFDANGEVTEGPEIAGDDLWIQTSNDGKMATFRYSSDGERFVDIGTSFTLQFGLWTGDRLGFFCWNDQEDAGYLDVDWFRYDYDGPKGVVREDRGTD
jgi:beta-xylosidase